MDKKIKDFDELKRERIKDDKSREKDRKVFGFFNKLILIEIILGLAIILAIYLFYYNKLT